MSGTLQDRPRAGGFPEISWRRNLPERGPSGAVLFAVAAACTIIGFNRVIAGNQKRRRLAAEKYEARRALLPFLVAEQERAQIRKEAQLLLAEEKIMENVTGWKVGESVFKTMEYVPANMRL